MYSVYISDIFPHSIDITLFNIDKKSGRICHDRIFV